MIKKFLFIITIGILTITNAAVGTRIQVINAAGGDAEKWHAYVASMSTVDATIS